MNTFNQLISITPMSDRMIHHYHYQTKTHAESPMDTTFKVNLATDLAVRVVRKVSWLVLYPTLVFQQTWSLASRDRFISSRDGSEIGTKTRHEMKERKKTIRHLHSRCRIAFLRSFISCLVSVLYSGSSLLEMNFCRNIFP